MQSPTRTSLWGGHGARQSLSHLIRPSNVQDNANLFAGGKIEHAKMQLFSSDILMEGELNKKGENRLQTWKNRKFVLRGHELAYYIVENDHKGYGALKGTMNVQGAQVERQDQLGFTMTLSNGKCRSFQAPDVKSLMEWMTALAVASEALVVNPPSELQLVDHSKTTHILLVRHGHYMSQTNAMADLNAALSNDGVKQSQLTGQFLREYLNARGVLTRFPEFPIHHSGVRRSAQTAQIIAEALKSNTPLLENKLFREAWPGNPLPQTNQKVIAREKLDNMVSDCARLQIVYRTMFRHVIPADLSSREMQLSEQDVRRFQELFGKSTQARLNDRYRIIVCHANIIRWFVCKALGIDPDGTWGRMRSNHCSVTAMEVDSVGNVTLGFVNQTGHLGAELMTENN